MRLTLILFPMLLLNLACGGTQSQHSSNFLTYEPASEETPSIESYSVEGDELGSEYLVVRGTNCATYNFAKSDSKGPLASARLTGTDCYSDPGNSTSFSLASLSETLGKGAFILVNNIVK